MRDQDVIEMRWERHRGSRLKELAKKYGVSEGHVSRIVRGEFRPNLGGPIAGSRIKDHCLRGHEYTPENTVTKHGRRNCRRCKNDQSSASKLRKRTEITKPV